MIARRVRVAALLLAVALVSPLIADPVEAQMAEKNYRFGVKGLLYMAGEAYVTELDATIDTDMSIGVGGFVDAPLGERLIGSAFLDIANFSAADESAMLFNLGVMLKAALANQPGALQFRPGFGIGYASLGSTESVASTSYLTVNAGLEVLSPTGFLGELGMFYAPTGGNDDSDVEIGPLLILKFGRIF